MELYQSTKQFGVKILTSSTYFDRAVGNTFISYLPVLEILTHKTSQSFTAKIIKQKCRTQVLLPIERSKIDCTVIVI